MRDDEVGKDLLIVGVSKHSEELADAAIFDDEAGSDRMCCKLTEGRASSELNGAVARTLYLVYTASRVGQAVSALTYVRALPRSLCDRVSDLAGTQGFNGPLHSHPDTQPSVWFTCLITSKIMITPFSLDTRLADSGDERTMCVRS